MTIRGSSDRVISNRRSSPKGLQIFIFERQFPSLFVKFDGVSQFALLPPPCGRRR